MKTIIVIISVIIVAGVLAGVITLMSGDGSLKSRLTLGGIYAVENVGNHNVTCFVKKDSGSIDCIPSKDFMP